jgi:hypothetical protein
MAQIGLDLNNVFPLLFMKYSFKAQVTQGSLPIILFPSDDKKSDSTVLVPENFIANPPQKATNKGYCSYNQHHSTSKLLCFFVGAQDT